MTTTLKVSKETRERLLSLELAEKGKTFDMVINDLITFFQRNQKHYTKAYSVWEKQQVEYVRKKTAYELESEKWNKLMKWAKSKGFKG